MPKVLIVEDDPTIRTAVMRALTGKGYAVASAHNAMTGIQFAVSEHPDVVVLDLGLPDLDGREVLRMIRSVSSVPIIVATARGTEEDIVHSLDAGADDYVVKPYGGAQLDARIRAVLRRAAGPAEDPVLEVGGLRVDRRARQAFLDGAQLDLTPREFDLLHYLAARAGTVVSKQELLVEVWQLPYGGADKSLDVHLSWLRRKLGESAEDPRYLHTVRRVGVRLDAPAEPDSGLMRRRLALLVAAVMAMVLVAFVVPLAIVVRLFIADRAIADATEATRSVSALVASGTSPALVRQAIPMAGVPITVFLPKKPPIGAPASVTPAVRLAKTGQSFTVADPGGREILVAVQGLNNGTAVVRAFVSDTAMSKGVTGAWLVLAALGVILLGLGIAVADRLLGTVTSPIGDLARVSHVLAAGDLDARAGLAGPPEVREVAGGLNHLAGRIRDLIWQERERVADLSHRLRTPLTALRLEVEAMPDEQDPDGRLLHQVAELERAVTSLIEDARTQTRTAARCDATEVVTERIAFWSVLATDQGRAMGTELATGPLPVGVAAAELAACLDALLGNVFAHTPQGTSFGIGLRPRAAGGAILSVTDTGPGFAGAGLVRRGASGGQSTGLGLDIARQAAEASGGSLTIRPGNGGHVIVELGPPQPAL